MQSPLLLLLFPRLLMQGGRVVHQQRGGRAGIKSQVLSVLRPELTATLAGCVGSISFAGDTLPILCLDEVLLVKERSFLT